MMLVHNMPNGRILLTYRMLVNTQQGIFNIGDLPGYMAGRTDVYLDIASGVYLWSDSTSAAGLKIVGAAGDRVFMTNRGYIMGRGGNGGSVVQTIDGNTTLTAPTGGGHALELSGVYCEIDNSIGYIAGGGGGGGASYMPGGTGEAAGGGGGAGGGTGGNVQGANSDYDGAKGFSGGAGGGVGTAGQYGGAGNPGNECYASGGGGGRVLPGSTTAGTSYLGDNTIRPAPGGTGGGAGGVSGLDFPSGSPPHFDRMAAGGGGGWGASGGDGYYFKDLVNPSLTATGGSGGAGGSAGGRGTMGNGSGSLAQSGAAGGSGIILSNGASRLIKAGSTRIFGAY